MLLPETVNFLPYLIASSIIFCTRCTLEENVAIMIRPLALLNILSRASPTNFSDFVKPFLVAFVLSASIISTPCIPISANF